MKEETKIYKKVFTLRKGGENGEKYFYAIGNMMLSTKFHDTESEATKELEDINLESIARMLIAVINACNEMIRESLNNKEK